MNIPPQLSENANKPLTKLWRVLQQYWQRLAITVNGNIEFGNPTSGPANIRGNWVSVVTPGAANTDFTVTHNLGRAVVGYIVMTKSAACDVYTSPTANANPTTQFILRATATTVTLTIFFI